MTGEPFSLAWREDQYRDRSGPSDIADQMPFLLQCAAGRQVIAELGVRTGRSTAALLLGAHWGKGHVWSVDINPPDVPLVWHQDPRWSFAQCDSTSAQALAFAPDLVDLLFVDTSHSYTQTVAELAAWMPRVRRGGGIALFHDTHWGDGDIALPGPDGPVAQALTDYCAFGAETAMAWRDQYAGPGTYGLGVIEL